MTDLYKSIRNNLNDFQKDLHWTDDEKVDMYSIHFSQFRKATWFFRQIISLNSNGGSYEYNSDGKFKRIRYEIPTDSYHSLNRVTIELNNPRIQVKNDSNIEICLTDNWAYNNIKKFTITLNNIPIYSNDNIYYDIHSQSIVNKDAHNYILGNVPELLEWNKFISEWKAMYNIPTFYSINTGSFLPLYLLTSMDNLHHTIEYKDNLMDYLKIREKIVRTDDAGNTTSHYVQIPCKNFKNYFSHLKVNDVDVKNMDNCKLEDPIMFASVDYLAELELNSLRCEQKNESDGSLKPFKLYIEDIYATQSDNTCELGKLCDVKLTCKYPIHTIYWNPQNEEAIRFNNQSNYSTNADHQSFGWSPILWTSLSYKNDESSYIFKEMGTNFSERNNWYTHTGVIPSRDNPGYNMSCMGAYLKDPNAKPGIVFENGKMSVKLADTNPFNYESSGHHADGDWSIPHPDLPDIPSRHYKIQVRALYTKAIIFSKYAASDEERISGGTKCSFTTIGSS